MHIVAPIKLVIVENGIIFGSTISGMYSHGIGPKDNPKFAMKTIIPIDIKIGAKFSSWSWMKKPKNTRSKLKHETSVPN